MQSFNNRCKFSFNLILSTSIKRTLLKKTSSSGFFLDSAYRCKTESSRKNSTDNTRYEPFATNFSKMLNPSKQCNDNKKTIDTPSAIENF